MTNTDELKKLILEAREEGLSPNRLSEILVSLTSWYATLAQELEDIEVFYAEQWLAMRKECKTDKATDMAWNSSESGKQRIRLRIQLKYIEKIISSIKVRLKVKENESWGRY